MRTLCFGALLLAAKAADVAETGGDQLSNTVANHGFKDVSSNYSEHRARRAVFFY